MSYEQRHTHDEIERLAAKLNEPGNTARDREVEQLVGRMVTLVADVAHESAAFRVRTVCEWLRGVEAEEIIEGADVARLQPGETLAVAIERRFGGAP
jgi:hypothetical protein